MATFLKIAGGFIIAVGLLILAFVLVVGRNDPLTSEPPPAFGVILAGALICAFGLMLEHLETISRHSAKQAELLTELVRKMPKADSAARPSEANSLDQLTKSNFRFKDI
ncbi:MULTISPECIES: hypothetical protein [unclassified Rhizobium]|uniref:hypothetical protein n=1 Tax=unclassified Rhizobium TaxID=2613769 RepID=UPI000EA98966|nr:MULTISPECIES: hypothetical protein [unclassified Rhizobium]